MQANLLKSLGYVISTLSVLLLGLVAWSSTKGDPGLRTLLIGGMAASIAGMFLRWLSYQVDAKQGPNASAPQREAPLR